MRIYLAETKTAGKVRCSVEVKDTCNVLHHWTKNNVGYEDWRLEFASLDKSTTTKFNHKKSMQLMDEGYLNQKYAIEIKNVEEVDFKATDMIYADWRGCKGNCDEQQAEFPPCTCEYYGDCCGTWSEFEGNYLTGVPKLFCYIVPLERGFENQLFITNTKGILMSCEKQWIDMILAGDKIFLFVNKLPKALKEDI